VEDEDSLVIDGVYDLSESILSCLGIFLAVREDERKT